MKAHTNEFKQSIGEFGKEIDSKITYTINGTTTTLGTEQLNSVTPTYKGDILKSVMKELDLDSNVEIPKETIINYKFGVKVGNEYEYIDYGNYIVFSCNKKEDTNSYEIVCYDKMLNSMVEYHKTSLLYPVTMLEYLNKICRDINIQLENEEFANKDREVEKDVFEEQGYTYRDVLDQIAQATGSTICINNNDKLEIRYINDNTTENQATGNPIELTDAIDYTQKSLQIDGKSEQNGTPTPTNPIEIKNVKGITNLLNKYTVIETSSQYATTLYGEIDDFKPNTTYIISFEGEVGNKIYCNEQIFNQINSVVVNGTNTMILKTKANIDKTNIEHYYNGRGWRIFKNFTGNSVVAKFRNVMLEKGTIAHSYVPYGTWLEEKTTGKNLCDTSKFEVGKSWANDASSQRASILNIPVKPNTKYRFDIDISSNSSLNATYLMGFKNIGDKSTTCYLSTSGDITTTSTTNYFSVEVRASTTMTADMIKNVKVSLIENGTEYEPYKEHTSLIDMNKTNLFDKDTTPLNAIISDGGSLVANNDCRTVYIKCKNNTTYNISKVSSLYFRVAQFVNEPKAGDSYVSRIKDENGATNLTFKTTTGNYLAINYYVNRDTLTEQQIRESIIIYESENTTPYHELCKIGDIQDTYKDGVITKRIGKVVLNGSESGWTDRQSYNSADRFVISEFFKDNNKNIICDYLPTETSLKDTYPYILNNNKQLVINFSAKGTTTLSQFKTWLSTNNVVVYYVLATPYEINVSNEDIELFEGYNNITLNDSLEPNMIVKYANGYETITEDYIKDTNVTFGETYGPINSIVLSRSDGTDNVYIQDEESVEENGLHELKIKDNQLMNNDNRSEFLPELLEKLDGLKYSLNDFTSPGVCYLDLCDKYNVQIGENTYNCIMFNDEVNITQGLEETIYTEKPEETETDYTKADKTDQKIYQTSLIVDKQGKEITSVVSSLDEITTYEYETKEKTGYPIEIEDCANLDINGLEIEGQHTISTRNPSPDSPAVINSVKGITNLISGVGNTSNGLTTINNNGEIKVSGTTNNTWANLTRNNASDSLPLGIGTYTLSISGLETYYLRMSCYYEDGTNGIVTTLTPTAPKATFTLSKKVSRYYLWLYNFASGTTINTTYKVMLEQGSVSHEFVPYGTWLVNKTMGKNLFDKDNAIKGAFVSNKITSNASWEYNTISNWKVGDTLYIKGGRAFISFFNGSTNIAYYDRTNSSIVIPENTTQVYVSTNIGTTKIMISTADVDYEEYKERTQLIDFNKYVDNKNLLTFDKKTETTEDNSVIVDIEENGYIKVNALTSTDYALTLKQFKLDAGKYNFHGMDNGASESTYYTTLTLNYSGGGGYQELVDDGSGINFEVYDGDACTLTLELDICSGVKVDKGFQLEINKENNGDILTSIELLKNGTLKADISGNVVITNEYIKQSINAKSNEAWESKSSSLSDYYLFKTKLDNFYMLIDVFSNLFPIVQFTGTLTQTTGEKIYIKTDASDVGDGTIYLQIKASRLAFETVDSLKVWLSSNQIDIYTYSDVIETNYSKTDMLQVFEGYNYITLNSTPKSMKVKYQIPIKKTRFEGLESEIKQNADAIKLTVKKGEVISEINQTAEETSITANKINFNGLVTANENFKINDDGSMSSVAGNIAEWNINNEALYKDTEYGDATYRVYMQPVLDRYLDDTWIYSVQYAPTKQSGFFGRFIVDGAGKITSQNGRVYTEIELFYYNDGYNGTITLNDDISNYNYIEIIAKVWNTNDLTTTGKLPVMYPYQYSINCAQEINNGSQLVFFENRYTGSGNQLIPQTPMTYNSAGSNAWYKDDNQNFKVVRVLGYK